MKLEWKQISGKQNKEHALRHNGKINLWKFSVDLVLKVENIKKKSIFLKNVNKVLIRFFLIEVSVNKTRRQPSEYEKIFVNEATNKI